MKPVSKTAFYCCGVRMADAERRRPLCGDNYAKRFMDAEARAFYQSFKAEKQAARGNATRHRIIDDHLRGAIGATAGLTVVTIGAGFDTRPYRLHAGTFIELDEPALIARKNEKLPISECKNALTRVAIDFAQESLFETLAPFKSHAPHVFVLEGVLMYLEQSVIAEMLRTLGALFPNHTLVCDLMRRAFADRYSGSLRTRIEQLGAQFRVVDDPYEVFAQNHYRVSATVSIAERSVELTLPPLLHGVLRTMPKAVRDGYKIVVFAPSP